MDESRHRQRRGRQQAQVRAPGRSLRSVSQASASASATHSGTVTVTSNAVLTSNSPTRGRKTRLEAVSQPACQATQTTKPSGTSDSSDTASAARLIHDTGSQRLGRRARGRDSPIASPISSLPTLATLAGKAIEFTATSPARRYESQSQF